MPMTLVCTDMMEHLWSDLWNQKLGFGLKGVHNRQHVNFPNCKHPSKGTRAYDCINWICPVFELDL